MILNIQVRLKLPINIELIHLVKNQDSMFIDALGHYRSSEDKIKQRNTRHKGGGGVCLQKDTGSGCSLQSPTSALQKPSKGTCGLESLSQVMIVSKKH